MEMEYKDPSRRGRWIVLLGVVLALVAGGSAFFLINNAQQQAGTSGLKTVQGYVAARPILARKAIVAEDITLRKDIPLDGTNAAVITDQQSLVGRLLSVDVAQGQLLTANLLASGTVGLGFAILRPDETVGPDSEAWRAVSITVSDDRAVGGVLGAGMSVDVFVTATVTVPEEPPVISADPSATPAPAHSVLDGFMTGRSTKITYQGMTILARTGTYYILRAPLVVAEEISHMQADGGAQFSLALRPDQDVRILDVSALGATTNRIVQRYGLPIPEVYPTKGGPIPSNPPIPALTPAPAPTVPPAQPAPSGSPANPPVPSPVGSPAASPAR
jgi:Flp pilus assembly protein CpaB